MNFPVFFPVSRETSSLATAPSNGDARELAGGQRVGWDVRRDRQATAAAPCCRAGPHAAFRRRPPDETVVAGE
jgi:hypothetical protein